MPKELNALEGQELAIVHTLCYVVVSHALFSSLQVKSDNFNTVLNTAEEIAQRMTHRIELLFKEAK